METPLLGVTAVLGMLVSALCQGVGHLYKQTPCPGRAQEQEMICYFVVYPGNQEKWEVGRF